MINTEAIAQTWLANFALALSTRNVEEAVSLFLADGWLRDELVFSWNFRSLEGHKKIRAFLAERLPDVTISDVQLERDAFLTPSSFTISPQQAGVQFGFKFEAPAIAGRGFVRLLKEQDATESWKALTVFMTVADLKGYEEQDRESGLYGGHTLTWQSIRDARCSKTEAEHDVLIVGAGQTGLNVAARLKQHGISALVIEKHPRIGDNWRVRYPMVTLHTPRTHHGMLYMPYPKKWPTYTPRDKLASWLEYYADAQDLVVWNSTELVPTPVYDEQKKRWSATVIKNGVPITLHPAHIVIATGTLGRPRIPNFPAKELFKGQTLHAAHYAGGHLYRNQRVVVIGAGNTSADICQDLAHHGAEVTMVQRSATCIVSSAWVMKGMENVWPEGVPTEVSDFKMAAMPLGLLKHINKAQQPLALEFDKELHDGLKKAGFQLTQGPEGHGQLILAFETGGGYWIDVGCGELIANGRVKVKSGQEILRLKEDGVVFADGTELEADTIIYATGYEMMHDVMRGLFGASVINQTSQVWGLDHEGELRGGYKPSGYQGLWYAAGDFWNSRWQSKLLAVQLKADQLGMLKYPSAGSIPETNNSPNEFTQI